MGELSPADTPSIGRLDRTWVGDRAGMGAFPYCLALYCLVRYCLVLYGAVLSGAVLSGAVLSGASSSAGRQI